MNNFFHSLDTSLHQIFTLEAKKNNNANTLHLSWNSLLNEKCQEIWFAVSKPQSQENAVGSCKPKKTSDAIIKLILLRRSQCSSGQIKTQQNKFDALMSHNPSDGYGFKNQRQGIK